LKIMADRRPRILLLASPNQEPRASRLAGHLAASWQVLRPAPGDDGAALRALADSTDLVLHLDTAAADALGESSAAEVYAPDTPACDGAPDGAAFLIRLEAEAALTRRARLTITPDIAGREMIQLLHGVPDSRSRFVPDSWLGQILPLALTPAPDEGVNRILLAFNDYPVDNPRAGGQVRIRDSLSAFGQPTVLLTLAPRGRAVWLAPGVVQLSAPKSDPQRAEEAESRHLTGHGLEDILSAAHASRNQALAGAIAALAPRAACAIFHHCYLAPLIDPLRSAAPDLPMVYDSHNVEATLKATLLAGHPAIKALSRYVDAIERRLAAAADTVLCCSETDAAHFTGTARDIVMLPHGMAPRARRAAPGGPLTVGFLGSAHPPNLAAARYVIAELAPRFRHVKFDIAGAVCAGLESGGVDNVVLHGAVTEAQKHNLLQRWSLALNPVAEGGGASVKLADYLAHGLPSLSTPRAAAGYPLASRGAGAIADLVDFPAVIDRLLARPERLEAMRGAAAALGQERDWPVVATAARSRIAALMSSRPRRAPRPPHPRADDPPPLDSTADVRQPAITDTWRLADVMDRVSGRAHDRALLSRALSDADSVIIMVEDPSAPMSRARARAIADAHDTDIVLASGEQAWRVPPRGECGPLSGGMEQLLIASTDRCKMLVPTGTDDRRKIYEGLASRLGIPIAAPGRAIES